MMRVLSGAALLILLLAPLPYGTRLPPPPPARPRPPTSKAPPPPNRAPRVDCASCHAEAPADVAKSAHAALGPAACASCHGSAHTPERAASVAADKQICAAS